MIAFQIAAYGSEPQIVTLPVASPKAGEIRVKIEACGVNFADLLMIKGKYQERPTPPVTLGMELAGVVDAVGPEVTDFAPGDRIAAYSGQGGMAEIGCFPANRCVKLPESIRFDTAAGLLIAYGTSHLALGRRARLQPGETVLVLGAAGGVGLTAVEIAKRMGARVIACARGAEKLKIAERAGADHLIDASDDLVTRVRELGRADVVYDPVGGDLFRDALRAVNPEARMLAIGFASGDVPQIPANHLLVKNVDVIGLNLGAYLQFNPGALMDSFAQILEWHAQGALNLHISHRIPLPQAAQALELLRTRQATGKVIIQP